jgi:hypothetical protein
VTRNAGASTGGLNSGKEAILFTRGSVPIYGSASV